MKVSLKIIFFCNYEKIFFKRTPSQSTLQIGQPQVSHLLSLTFSSSIKRQQPRHNGVSYCTSGTLAQGPAITALSSYKISPALMSRLATRYSPNSEWESTSKGVLSRISWRSWAARSLTFKRLPFVEVYLNHSHVQLIYI